LAPGDPPPTIPATPEGLPSTLVERRPDVAAAERRAFAANRSIGVARAAFFPTLTLAPEGGFQNTGQANLLIAPNTFWTLGSQAALTLFDGGQRRAALALSRAGFARAADDYRATVIAAFQDVEDQLALSSHLAAEATDQSDAVRASQATTILSLIRYREGATNYLDVVTAQTVQLQAEQTSLDLKTRRQRTVVALIRALGGGWTTADLPGHVRTENGRGASG
jgi:NodT family efflux transporter outer membrane factor (OMF) lipoprotein